MLKSLIRAKPAFSLKDLFYCDKFFINAFTILQVISFSFFFPLIYGGGFYADDVSRVKTGYYGWDVLGRPLAKNIAEFYSLGSQQIVDVMPFGYILTIFIVGCSAYSIYCKFKVRYSEYASTLSALFIINPFLVENLLYRYDSLGMVLSLFFVTMAFTLKNGKIGFAVKMLLLVVAMNFYQTFSPLYVGLIAIEFLLFLNKFKNKRKSVIFLFSNLLVFLFANIIYFLELVLFDFTGGRGELLSFNVNLPWLVFINFTAAFKPFYAFWEHSYMYLAVVVPVIFFSIVKLALQRECKILGGILISSMLVFMSGVGPLALLKVQFLAARGLSYFPVMLMTLSVIIIMGSKKAKWIMIIPVFACFVFVSRVGNMQSIQREFEKPILFSATKDLLALKSKGVKKIYSIGSIPLSGYVLNTIKNTPFNGFMSRGMWVATGLMHEYGNNDLKFEWSSAEGLVTKNRFMEMKNSLELSADHAPFYRIYSNGSEGWVVWGG